MLGVVLSVTIVKFLMFSEQGASHFHLALAPASPAYSTVAQVRPFASEPRPPNPGACQPDYDTARNYICEVLT